MRRTSPLAVSWAPAAIFLATLAAYWPVLGGGFIWDDDGHVTRPELQSLHGLWRIWTELGATQQYYPVLHSAFWIEHRLWGDAPLGYHLLNILLHATAACLFGVILKRANVSASIAWLAAFIFALHPVGVESVAWISEQKNTLSAVFYLLAAYAYLRKYEVRSTKYEVVSSFVLRTSYFLSIFLFLLAVLSKSVTATLPGALLVLFWWKNGRLSWKRDVVPLVPWFAIAAAAGLLTAWVERTYVGAEGAAFHLSLLERCLLAGRVIWFYLGKLVWPANLIFIYPRWQVSGAVWWQYAFPLGVLGLIAAFWAIRKRNRAPLAALLFFIGTLFPALGFFNVYPFVFSYVADHFQYLAMMGAIAAAAAAITKYEVRSMKYEAAGAGSGMPRFVLRTSYFVLLPAVLGILTFRQCRMYRDVETLYETTLAKNPDAWLAHTNMGVILARAGRMPEAIDHYRQSLRLNPDFPYTYNDLGNAMANTGRLSEAVADYEHALRLRPAFVEARYNLGNALTAMDRLSEAIPQYEQVLRLDPHNAETHYKLGNDLGNVGRLSEAIVHYEQAVRLKPDYAEAHANLGLALAGMGRTGEAIGNLEQALRIKPDYAEAHAYLGYVLANSGRLPEAVAQYGQALQLEPNNPEIHYNLAVALRALGRTEDAKVQFDEAERLGAKR